MDSDVLTIMVRLFFAVLAGSIIGMERSYHGRPAGFRTHILVCLASGLLMLLTVFQWKLLPGVPIDTIRVDPTRMAQGIMTGIGFLGAGVILKESRSVRGLTTAASIWITASIGIIIGMGFYLPAVISVLFTLGALSLFRWIETVIPSQKYGKLTVRFFFDDIMSKDELSELIEQQSFTIFDQSFHLEDDGKIFRYEMTIRTTNQDNFYYLSNALSAVKRSRGFHITPIGN